MWDTALQNNAPVEAHSSRLSDSILRSFADTPLQHETPPLQQQQETPPLQQQRETPPLQQRTMLRQTLRDTAGLTDTLPAPERDTRAQRADAASSTSSPPHQLPLVVELEDMKLVEGPDVDRMRSKALASTQPGCPPTKYAVPEDLQEFPRYSSTKQFTNLVYLPLQQQEAKVRASDVSEETIEVCLSPMPLLTTHACGRRRGYTDACVRQRVKRWC